MVERRWEGLLPAAGVAFGVLFAVALALGGDMPSVKASGEQIVSHYADREGKEIATALLLVVSAVLIMFFAGALRKHLRAAAGDDSAFPSIALVGGAVYGVALLFEAALKIAMTDVGKEGLGDAAPALNVLQNDDFFLFIGGLSVMLLATAAVAVRGVALPAWLGWVSLVLGVAALAGPIGIAAFLLFPLWVIVVSVVLLSRRTAQGALPAP